jgi:IclR family acetate operon transcriptional repressor
MISTGAFSILNMRKSPRARRPASLSAISTAVGRAVDVLDVIARTADGGRVSEVARLLELPKSSVWGILRTLEAKGVVVRDAASQRYTLGMRLLELGERAGRDPVLRQLARPYLVQLGEDTGELAYLAIVREEHVLYLDRVESRHPIRYIAEIGTRRPLHCTATGKLYLSFLPPAEALERARRSSLMPFTRSTITEPGRLRRELTAIRAQGYAISREELLEGVIGFAAPLLRGPGDMAGAFVVAALVARAREREEELARMTIRLAQQVSAVLARQGGGRRG